MTGSGNKSPSSCFGGTSVTRLLLPRTTSQRLISSPSLMAAMSLPCPSNARRSATRSIFSVPVHLEQARSQKLTFLSTPEDARVFPSGENARHVMALPCPLRVQFNRPLTTSQSRTVESTFPVARVLPSGLKATHVLAWSFGQLESSAGPSLRNGVAQSKTRQAKPSQRAAAHIPFEIGSIAQLLRVW